MMGRNARIMAGALLAALAAGAAIRPAVADNRAELLRDRELATPAGDLVTLGAWNGQVLVVNFWASWCAPCRNELPQLDRWNAAWSARGAQVVAVSIDSDRRRAERFALDRQLTLTVLHDGPGGLARQLDLPAVPTTYVLDRTGVIVLEVHGGGDRELALVKEAVDKLLAVPGRGLAS